MTNVRGELPQEQQPRKGRESRAAKHTSDYTADSESHSWAFIRKHWSDYT